MGVLQLVDAGDGGELLTGSDGDLLESASPAGMITLALYGGSSPLDALKGADAQRDEFINLSRASRLTPSSLKRMSAAANLLLGGLVQAGFLLSVSAECRNIEGEKVSTIVRYRSAHSEGQEELRL